MFDTDPMWPNNQHTSEVFLLDGTGQIREFVTTDGENYFWDITGSDERKEDLVVQQFTGLTDKNGKEIYEGDIVISERFEQDGNFVVIYEPGIYLLKNHSNPVDLRYSLAAWASRLSVIGNILENPELKK